MMWDKNWFAPRGAAILTRIAMNLTILPVFLQKSSVQSLAVAGMRRWFHVGSDHPACKSGCYVTRIACFFCWLVLLVTARADPAAAPVSRLAVNPIITPGMLPGHDGANINGPSLIRVPEWLPNPLGKYYLYFANHHGTYIRLAYADHLEGPWKVLDGGVLSLQDVPAIKKHIASPDVHIDSEKKELRMYFHGPSKAEGAQMTFYSSSKDGRKFTADTVPLCRSYLRAFRWDGWWYGIAKEGQLYRSKDGRTPFTRGGFALPRGKESDTINDIHARHVAVDLRGDTLRVYYSNIGDAPEHILRGSIRLTGDWMTWKAVNVQSFLRPELPWEGARLRVRVSNGGAAKKAEHALRDPAVFVDADGKSYLLYSIAGEFGLAIAEITRP